MSSDAAAEVKFEETSASKQVARVQPMTPLAGQRRAPSARCCNSCLVPHWPVKLKIVGPITTRHQCHSVSGGLRLGSASNNVRAASLRSGSGGLKVIRSTASGRNSPARGGRCQCVNIVLSETGDQEARRQSSCELSQEPCGRARASSSSASSRCGSGCGGHQLGLYTAGRSFSAASKSMPSSRSMSLTSHELHCMCSQASTSPSSHSNHLLPSSAAATAATSSTGGPSSIVTKFHHPELTKLTTLTKSQEFELLQTGAPPRTGSPNSQMVISIPGGGVSKGACPSGVGVSGSDTDKSDPGQAERDEDKGDDGDDDDDDQLRREGEDEFDCTNMAQLPTRFKANSISSCVRLLSSSASQVPVPAAPVAPTTTCNSQCGVVGHSTSTTSTATAAATSGLKCCLLCDLSRHLTIISQQQQEPPSSAGLTGPQSKSLPPLTGGGGSGTTKATHQEQVPEKDYLKPGDYSTASSKFNRLFPPPTPQQVSKPRRRHSWICR